jgi:tRNA(Ile)-lysidine synthase
LWLTPDIKAKFLDGARRCGIGAGAEETARIGVAVSGGPDSLALLLLAQACFNGRVFAATVDHQLRAEAAAEASFVAKLCAQNNIPQAILTPPKPITGNIQSSARHARYALLEKWADDNQCTYIATAHHADDQLETILMRLARGSGVDGLSGVRAINGRIVRPLLAFTKSELSQICIDAGVIPIQDPSNHDLDFDRVRMREWLATSPGPLSAISAAHSAAALSDASLALDWMTDKLASERIEQQPRHVALNPDGLPHELQRRLLLRALALIEPDTMHRGSAIDRGLDSLSQGKTITLGNVLCQGGSIWRFTPAPLRASDK